MRYRSLRGASPLVDFRTALLDGLAPDGSLYAPEALPRLPESFLARLDDADLPAVAVETLRPFVDPLPVGDLEAIVGQVFDFPIPLVRLDDHLQLLELFHGPTLAFKDVGARFMARTLGQVLAHEQRDVVVLVATSGDTGSAVAAGFHGVPHVAVYVLYPSGRVSELQELQMTTLGGNVHAVEVAGTFDDCQRLVKQALAARRADPARTFTTANSINVGRLLPQIVYYVWAYAQWRRGAVSGRPASGPDFVVPSGNFGNVTAAAYARAMGVPVRRLIAATNANDVVPAFLRTGQLVPRPSVTTLSNAMDVGNPSNLGRLERLADFQLDRLRRDLESIGVSDAATLETIRTVHARTGLLVDPHTAVGLAAAGAHVDHATIVAATAHPAKFPDVIRRAIGREPELPPALAGLRHRPKQAVRIEATDTALDALLDR